MNETTMNEITTNGAAMNETTINEATANEAALNEAAVNETTMNPAAASPPPGASGFFVHRHFLRDLSVENPAGPIGDEDVPRLRLGMEGRVTARPLAAGEMSAATPDAAGERHEVTVGLTLTALVDERAVFLAEIAYAAEVELRHIAAERVTETLCVAVPTALFPAVREVLQRCGAFAGYPTMQVAPLDFAAIFARQQAALTPPAVAAAS